MVDKVAVRSWTPIAQLRTSFHFWNWKIMIFQNSEFSFFEMCFFRKVRRWASRVHRKLETCRKTETWPVCWLCSLVFVSFCVWRRFWRKSHRPQFHFSRNILCRVRLRAQRINIRTDSRLPRLFFHLEIYSLHVCEKTKIKIVKFVWKFKNRNVGFEISERLVHTISAPSPPAPQPRQVAPQHRAPPRPPPRQGRQAQYSGS